jgi:hypothetical protein
MSNKTNDSKSIFTLSTNKNIMNDSIPCRLDFIRDLMRGQRFDPLVNFNQTKEDLLRKKKNNNNESDETYDTRITLKKRILNFNKVIKTIGNGSELIYIKSGTTGHTFKGKCIDNGKEIEYAVKVVAYPKKEKYGSIHDARRPENAEIAMIQLLSYFIVKKETPHIVLPFGTFNTDIKSFIGLIDDGIISKKNEKYQEFEKKYRENKYHDEVSILISEWANKGDLLDFIRNNYKKFYPLFWKVIFFQIISTLAVIQRTFPSFRHNDLKANNVLVQKIDIQNQIFTYRVARCEYKVKNIGYQIKLWDFDFACIPNYVDNIKVESTWTKDINVTPEQNRYYDLHYFFNTLIGKGFFEYFMTKDCIPQEAKDFVNRIVPKKYQKYKKNSKTNYVHERGRLLVKDEYTTPDDVLKYDPYFEEFRVDKSTSNKNYLNTKQNSNDNQKQHSNNIQKQNYNTNQKKSMGIINDKIDSDEDLDIINLLKVNNFKTNKTTKPKKNKTISEKVRNVDPDLVFL